MISTVVRRCAAVFSLLTTVGIALWVSAGAAAADTPVPRPGSWEPKPDVNLLEAFLFLGGVPLLFFVVVCALYIGPALSRGETINPAKRQPASQWIGGPRKSAGELADPDGEGSAAGGAGGSW